MEQHEGQFALNVVRELLSGLQRDVTANNAESPVLAESHQVAGGAEAPCRMRNG